MKRPKTCFFSTLIGLLLGVHGYADFAFAQSTQSVVLESDLKFKEGVFSEDFEYAIGCSYTLFSSHLRMAEANETGDEIAIKLDSYDNNASDQNSIHKNLNSITVKMFKKTSVPQLPAKLSEHVSYNVDGEMFEVHREMTVYRRLKCQISPSYSDNTSEPAGYQVGVYIICDERPYRGNASETALIRFLRHKE